MNITEINRLKAYYDTNLIKYENAMHFIVVQLENLRHELKRSKHIRNPIDSVCSRIKTFESFAEKCEKKALGIDDEETIEYTVKDVAGVRIITQYKDDIYRIIDYLGHLPGVSIVRTKDYIKSPKPSGYMSVHLNTLVQIPTIEKGTQMVPVEIQLRTLSMQAWAQVEHRARYKSINGTTAETEEQLKRLSEIFNEADELAIKIRHAGEDD